MYDVVNFWQKYLEKRGEWTNIHVIKTYCNAITQAALFQLAFRLSPFLSLSLPVPTYLPHSTPTLSLPHSITHCLMSFSPSASHFGTHTHYSYDANADFFRFYILWYLFLKASQEMLEYIFCGASVIFCWLLTRFCLASYWHKENLTWLRGSSRARIHAHPINITLASVAKHSISSMSYVQIVWLRSVYFKVRVKYVAKFCVKLTFI